MAMSNVHHYTSISNLNDPLSGSEPEPASWSRKRGLAVFAAFAVVALVGTAIVSSNTTPSVMENNDMMKGLSSSQIDSAVDNTFQSFHEFWAKVEGDVTDLIESVEEEYAGLLNTNDEADLTALFDQVYNRILYNMNQLEQVTAISGNPQQQPLDKLLGLISDAVEVSIAESAALTPKHHQPNSSEPHTLKHHQSGSTEPHTSEMAQHITALLRAQAEAEAEQGLSHKALTREEVEAVSSAVDGLVSHVVDEFWPRVEEHVTVLADEMSEAFMEGLIMGDLATLDRFVDEVETAIIGAMDALADVTEESEVQGLTNSEVEQFIQDRVVEAVDIARASLPKTKRSSSPSRERPPAVQQQVSQCSEAVVGRVKNRYSATLQHVQGVPMQEENNMNIKTMRKEEIQESVEQIMEAGEDMWPIVREDVESLIELLVAYMDPWTGDEDGLLQLVTLAEERIQAAMDERSNDQAKSLLSDQGSSQDAEEFFRNRIMSSVEEARDQALDAYTSTRISIESSLPTKEDVERTIDELADYLESKKPEIEEAVDRVVGGLQEQFDHITQLLETGLSDTKAVNKAVIPKPIVDEEPEQPFIPDELEEPVVADEATDFMNIDAAIEMAWREIFADMVAVTEQVMAMTANESNETSDDADDAENTDLSTIVIVHVLGFLEPKEEDTKSTESTETTEASEDTETIVPSQPRCSLQEFRREMNAMRDLHAVVDDNFMTLTPKMKEQAEATATQIVNNMRAAVEADTDVVLKGKDSKGEGKGEGKDESSKCPFHRMYNFFSMMTDPNIHTE